MHRFWSWDTLWTTLKTRAQTQWPVWQALSIPRWIAAFAFCTLHPALLHSHTLMPHYYDSQIFFHHYPWSIFRPKRFSPFMSIASRLWPLMPLETVLHDGLERVTWKLCETTLGNVAWTESSILGKSQGSNKVDQLLMDLWPNSVIEQKHIVSGQRSIN